MNYALMNRFLAHSAMRALKLFAVASLVFLAGCATNFGSKTVDDFGRYTQLEKDATDKVGVYDIFGQPHDVTYLASGECMWTYYAVSASMNGATFVPIVGLFAGGTNNTVRIGYIYFDQENLYQKVETQTKEQYVNQWVGIATIADENDEKDRVLEEMTKYDLPFDQTIADQMKGVQTLFDES
jgi:hypothetical protein